MSVPLPGDSAAFSFGSFDYFCSLAPLPLCPLVGSNSGGIEPICYARNIEFPSAFLFFQPATCFINIIALGMTFTMIYYIKSKYTAVGRKEIVVFFYMYSLTTIMEFFLVSNVVPASSILYRYFAAIHAGLMVATFWTLFFNGFVGFQWTEDGTSTSLWTLRISTFTVFILSFAVSILTFSNAGFQSTAPTALFVTYLILPATFLLVYIITQIILVFTTLDDRWPLADLLFGLSFYVLGLAMEFVLGNSLCKLATHYVDGMFFGSICSLLGVMMVYKFWDSITKEDLEFAVGGKSHVWETRPELLKDETSEW